MNTDPPRQAQIEAVCALAFAPARTQEGDSAFAEFDGLSIEELSALALSHESSTLICAALVYRLNQVVEEVGELRRAIDTVN